MVFAIQCPSAACRKFMLVEAAQRGQVIRCLICGVGIRTGPKSDGVKDPPAPPRKQGTG